MLRHAMGKGGGEMKEARRVERLGERLDVARLRAERLGATVGVYVEQVFPLPRAGAGPTVLAEYAADTPMMAASVNKLAIALAVSQLAASGELVLPAEGVLLPEVPLPGGGHYDRPWVAGARVPVGELCGDMLGRSGNTAAAALIRYVGAERVNDTLARLDLPTTRLLPSEEGSFYLGQTTPREAAEMLVHLMAASTEGDSGHIQLARTICHALRNSQVRRGSRAVLPGGQLPEGSELATKTGDWNGSDPDMPDALRHDVSLITTHDRIVAMALLCAANRPGIAEVFRSRATSEVLAAMGLLTRRTARSLGTEAVWVVLGKSSR